MMIMILMIILTAAEETTPTITITIHIIHHPAGASKGVPVKMTEKIIPVMAGEVHKVQATVLLMAMEERQEAPPVVPLLTAAAGRKAVPLKINQAVPAEEKAAVLKVLHVNHLSCNEKNGAPALLFYYS
jgi:hypothetical protein